MTIARQAGLDFVPAVESTRAGRTVVEHGGRAWEITGWMAGRADFHANPTEMRLFAAVAAVARIHAAWAGKRGERPVRPWRRRWTTLAAWDELLTSGWRPRIDATDPVRPAAEAAWATLPRLITNTRLAMQRWLDQPVPVQPCLCDVWHDHILYEGDRVTGVIDYAASKVDHVAVDLARLFGSLISDDDTRVQSAIEAYTAVRPLPQPELVAILDRTGSVVAVINWLRWLYHEGRAFSDRGAVAERLAGLVRRLERCSV